MRAAIPNEMLSGEYLFRRYGATLADYVRAADEDARLELYDGVMVMHSPANVRHERIFSFLLSLLRARSGREGEVLGSRTPMVLDEDRRFEPDLLFIRAENLHRLGEVELAGPADLVIEILSPATRDYDLNEKRQAYAEGGVPEYWMIDPKAERVLVDRPAATRHVELHEGILTPLALPTFELDVSWLWLQSLPQTLP